MDLGSFLFGNMLVGKFAIENMDHLIASYVAGDGLVASVDRQIRAFDWPARKPFRMVHAHH